MAAYGALISLTNTIHLIQNHPRPPISLHKTRIEPLIEKVAFLQDFLENYTIGDDADDLEGRMVDAAHKAEDIIESYIADHFMDRIRDEYEESLYQCIQEMMKEPDEVEDIPESQIAHHIEDEARGEANEDDDDSCLYRELQKVVNDLDSITKDVAAAAIKYKTQEKIADAATDDDVMNDVILDKLTNNPYWKEDDTNDVMNNVMSKLIDRQSSRWIIAIAGMGGIGKTTLAKNIYEHPLIVEHFDMRGWSTISQEFNSKRVLLEVLHCIGFIGSEDNEYEELGQKLYQSLFGRRYLIVMDDIWGTDAWDEMKRFFPNNDDGSRVLITTRPSKLALQLDGRDYFQMPFLNLDESWNLLRRCVFGEEQQGCPPPELEEIGKEIGRNCRGLPLSIVVIGGLLAKSGENWQHVLENLSSTVNLEEGERCVRTLKLSYDQLPVHLKPCFLYMGMFPEDESIYVPMLMRLWIDEGFVKPVAGKSLETIARVVYLNDLVLRNLVVVREWGYSRRIKRCSIHDLLRDLCIKEAEKYKFFLTTQHNYYPNHDDQIWCAQRRISIIQQAPSQTKYNHSASSLSDAVESASRARTLIWKVHGLLPSLVPFRLLRILNVYNIESFFGELFRMVNLRHLYIIKEALVQEELEFPPEFYLLWNLRTLHINHNSNYAPMLDIWRMPQLRDVKADPWFQLTDPPPPPMEVFEVLENLEKLKGVWNLRLGEEVVERIPNIKKLKIEYNIDDEELSPADSDYGLGNLCRLHKLESLTIFYHLKLRKNELMVTFPVSLRKLTLSGTELGWEEMGTKIGSLPYLEALELNVNAFVGPEWETTEGGFQSLMFLGIYGCSDLEQWRAEATHFPRLERLQLHGLDKLKKIPLGIGDINTLREIHVLYCPDSVMLSAKEILEEQEECFGEVELHIRVVLYEDHTQLRDLRSSQNLTVTKLRKIRYWRPDYHSC